MIRPVPARLLILALLVVSAGDAQPAVRRATNIEALLAFPGFFHLRPILLVGNVTTTPSGEIRIADDGGSLRVAFKGTAPDGLAEVRGEFWDVGRLKADDPRVASLDLRGAFHLDPDATWPKPGEVTAILATTVTPTSPPPAPSIRAIVLNPSRYVDQKVTISGQYEGRNLAGDLPDAPGRSRYDFVLRAADAAIWVTNVRPKGKTFELALDSRLDTSRWLEVTGIVRQGRGLQWIEGDAGTLALTKAPADTSAAAEPPVRVTLGPPPEVVFSAPVQDETDVAPMTNVRIQFSRDLDPKTLKDHVRVSYVQADAAGRGQPPAPPIEFTTQYAPASRVLELRFTKPLERFRTLKIDLSDAILGIDQQPLKPWTLTFALGG